MEPTWTSCATEAEPWSFMCLAGPLTGNWTTSPHKGGTEAQVPDETVEETGQGAVENEQVSHPSFYHPRPFLRKDKAPVDYIQVSAPTGRCSYLLGSFRDSAPSR